MKGSPPVRARGPAAAGLHKGAGSPHAGPGSAAWTLQLLGWKWGDKKGCPADWGNSTAGGGWQGRTLSHNWGDAFLSGEFPWGLFQELRKLVSSGQGKQARIPVPALSL